MGSHMAKPSNKSMVDRLVEHNAYIQSPTVESVFRAVDRAMYFDLEEGEVIDPYENDPWRRGNLHLSAPSIYAKVVEALELRSGLSFLNLGSGTGYLNTIIGLLVGPNGFNHGIELHSDVVEYAYKRLKQFKENSHAIDRFDFSEPVFVKGNCLNLNPNTRYDRIYLGAACLPDLENFMKKLIKPNGGILVMPYENHLMRYRRFGENEWRSEKLMDVNFTLMIRPGDNETMIEMPMAQAKSLKELCRIIIRQQLRDKTNLSNPSLLYSDNIGYRRLRKARAERDSMKRAQLQGEKFINSNVPNGIAEYLGPLSKRLNARSDSNNDNRRQRASKSSSSLREGRCCCWQYAGHNLESSSSGSRTQSQPGTSHEGRVMTRSASRRMIESQSNSSNQGNSQNISSINKQSESSSRGTSLNDYRTQTSSLDDSGEDGEGEDILDDGRMSQDSDNNGDDDDDDDDNPSAPRQRIKEPGNLTSSARTRPYVSCKHHRTRSANNERRSPACLLWQSSRSNNNHASPVGRVISGGGPPALLPIPSQIARIIDRPYSPSSPSESDSLSESDMPNIEEYDYVGRQVILSWPGILGLHRAINPGELNIHELDSSESSASESSASEILELDYTESSDGLSSLCESIMDDTFGPPVQINLDSDSEELLPTESVGQKRPRRVPSLNEHTSTPRPGTSRTSDDGLPASSSDQEPVASRLRSARQADTHKGQKRTNRPSDTIDSYREWARKYSYRPSQSPPVSMRPPLHCPIHGRYSNAVPTDSLASPPRLETARLRSNASTPNFLDPASSSPPPPISSPATVNRSLLASPGQHPSDERSLRSRIRVMSTTLTLSDNGSGRLFERQSVGSASGWGYHSCEEQAARLAALTCSRERQCKRKRRSSPSDDSSDMADEGCSHRSSPSIYRDHHSRRRLTAGCQCSNSSSASPIHPSPSATSVGSSRSFGCQTSSQRPSLGASWAQRESNHLACDFDYCSSSNNSQSNCSTSLVNNSNSNNNASPVQPAPHPTPSLQGPNMSTDINQARDANGSFCLSPTPSGQDPSRRSRRTKACQSHSHRNHRQHHHSHRHHHDRHNPNFNHTSMHSHPASTAPATSQGANEAPSRLGGGRGVAPAAVQVRHPCMVFDSNELANIRNQHRRSQLRRERARKEKRKRRETECDRYHNHISGYIRQLPLPRVLHSYLNYDRHYVAVPDQTVASPLKTPTPRK